MGGICDPQIISEQEKRAKEDERLKEAFKEE